VFFCKENRSNTLRTRRVHGPRPCTRHVYGRLHGPTRPARGRVHSRVHTHRPTCTPPLQGRVSAIYTAVYTAREHVFGRRVTGTRHVTRPCTRPRPCTRHVTRPCTHAYVYTAVTRPCKRHIHGRVHGQYTAVITGHVHGPYTSL